MIVEYTKKSVDKFNKELDNNVKVHNVDRSQFEHFFSFDIQKYEGEPIELFSWLYYEGLDSWFSQEVIEQVLWSVLVFVVHRDLNYQYTIHEELALHLPDGRELCLSEFSRLELVGDGKGYPEDGSKVEEYFGAKIEDLYECLVDEGDLAKVFHLHKLT